MYRYVVAVFVMFCCLMCCCCFSYHALLSLIYASHTAKMATAKKLAKEEGISIREAERWLDTDTFHDKYPRWKPCRFHCPFLIYWMFAHTTASRQKEYDQSICWHW